MNARNAEHLAIVRRWISFLPLRSFHFVGNVRLVYVGFCMMFGYVTCNMMCVTLSLQSLISHVSSRAPVDVGQLLVGRGTCAFNPAQVNGDSDVAFAFCCE